MAEETDRGSSDRQATWVAFKTLRQRPTVVGRTDDGDTVYEIRSVRLVFRPGSSHFNRLVTCARCGRDVPGSPILSVADLDRPTSPVFCDRCARPAGPLYPRVRAEREEPPAPGPPAETPPADNAGELARLAERVGGALREQNAELAKLSASVAEVRAEMRELGAEIASLRQRVDDESAARFEMGQHHHAEIEEKLARELVEIGTGLAAALTQGLDHFRSEIGSLQQRVDQSAARSEMEQVAEANRELAQAQRDLDQRVSELAAQLATSPRPDSGAEFAAVPALLEAQRKELTEALHDVAQETLLAVAEPLRELTKAREEFERRLGNATSRLDALEQKVHLPVQKRRPPKALLDSLERQLREAEERLGQL